MSIKKSTELSQYLKEMRMKKGLTQREVSQILGYGSSQYLSNIERGQCPPSIDALAELASLYRLDINRTIELCIAPIKAELERALKSKTRRK